MLGGIGFGSATWKLAARDAWIRWSADARAANITRVVRCHRFLLTPGVRVYGLASMSLRMAAARVADDWDARHSVRPVAVCTHVGPEMLRHVESRPSGRRLVPMTFQQDTVNSALA